MKKIALVILYTLLSATLNLSVANAGSYCNNGTYSMNSGRGTCSYNGGINRNFPSYSDPGSSSFNRNNGLGSGLNDSLGSGLSSYGSSRNKNSFGTGLGSSLDDPYSSWGSTSKKKSRW